MRDIDFNNVLKDENVDGYMVLTIKDGIVKSFLYGEHLAIVEYLFRDKSPKKPLTQCPEEDC